MMRLPAVGILLSLLIASAAEAETVDPDQLGLRHGWSENAGWIDAQPGGPGGEGLHVANGSVSGWLWAENLGWVSASCGNTDSCASAEYGLHLEDDPDLPGLLRLVGTAWSENAGWIVTHCTSSASCGDVDYGLRVDPQSGLVDGFAWSENLGWISFSCSSTDSCNTVDFGLQFDPQALAPPAPAIFADGLED